KRSCAPGSSASTSSMVRDSASELDSRYFAVNSYFPKYCSIRKGLICMAHECARREPPQSSAKLSRHASPPLRKTVGLSEGPPIKSNVGSEERMMKAIEPIKPTELVECY